MGMVNASLILREAVFSILQNMLACLEENEKEEETQAQSILDWMSLTWVKQEIVPLESGSMSMNGQRIRSRALGLLNNICAFGNIYAYQLHILASLGVLFRLSAWLGSG